MRELTIAERIVYETVMTLVTANGCGVHLGQLELSLGLSDTSIKHPNKVVNTLCELGLVKKVVETYQWRSVVLYECSTPVEIASLRQGNKKLAAVRESKRIKTPYEKNAIVIAKRKGLL